MTVSELKRGFGIVALMLSACTFQVNSTADSTDADPGDGECEDSQGRCTLRAAIVEANAIFTVDRIEVPAGTYLLTLPVASGGGQLVVDGSVAIRGAGAGLTIIDADAVDVIPGGAGGCPIGAERRVFQINSGNVGLSHLTVQGGSAQNGGGIFVEAGTVEITDAVIRRNAAFTGAGGLLNDEGVVRIRRSTVTENCATGAFGGGLGNQSNGQIWVYESLISGNWSNRAGGIRNSGILNLRSTTVSGNFATSPEAGTGGISQNGFAFLNNVTVTLNTGRGDFEGSFMGGGLQTVSGETTVVKNSIIAGNDGQGGPNDCDGALTSDSRYNLIGDTEGCDLPANTSTYLLDVDPQLGPLASNGGPTQTHALLQGSPAINSAYQFPMPAADGCEPRDQRGVPHPQGGVCDMGAFESGNANVFVTSFTLVDADADVDLFTIRSGEQLRLGDLPPNLSIRASMTGAAGSVVFAFDGNTTFQTENVPPYALGGDSPAGNYVPVPFSNGDHVIRATPFAAAGATGAAGGSLELRFNVVGAP